MNGPVKKNKSVKYPSDRTSRSDGFINLTDSGFYNTNFVGAEFSQFDIREYAIFDNDNR